MKQSLLLIFLSIFIYTYSNAQLASKSASQSTHQVLSKAKISVYPNPASDFIQLKDKDESVKQILVYNIVGTKMKTFPVSKDEKYYIADLPRGMYLIQLVGQQNKVLTTQRLSKR